MPLYCADISLEERCNGIPSRQAQAFQTDNGARFSLTLFLSGDER